MRHRSESRPYTYKIIWSPICVETHPVKEISPAGTKRILVKSRKFQSNLCRILAYLSSTTFWSRLANPFDFDVAKWNWNAPREFCDGGNHDLNRPRLHLAEYSRSRISLHFLKTTSRIYWAPCKCSRDYSALQFRKPDTMHAIICIFLQKRLRDL